MGGEDLLDLSAGLLELRLRAPLDGHDGRDAKGVHLRALEVVSERLGVLLGLAHGGRHVVLVDEVADLGTARVELVGVVLLGDLVQVVLGGRDCRGELPGTDMPCDGEVVGQARQVRDKGVLHGLAVAVERDVIGFNPAAADNHAGVAAIAVSGEDGRGRHELAGRQADGPGQALEARRARAIVLARHCLDDVEALLSVEDVRVRAKIADEPKEGISLLRQTGHRTLQRVGGNGNRDDAVAAHRTGGLGKHGAGPCVVLATQDVAALVTGDLAEQQVGGELLRAHALVHDEDTESDRVVERVEVSRPRLAHEILVLGSRSLIVDVIDAKGDGVGLAVDAHDAVNREQLVGDEFRGRPLGLDELHIGQEGRVNTEIRLRFIGRPGGAEGNGRDVGTAFRDIPVALLPQLLQALVHLTHTFLPARLEGARAALLGLGNLSFLPSFLTEASAIACAIPAGTASCSNFLDFIAVFSRRLPSRTSAFVFFGTDTSKVGTVNVSCSGSARSFNMSGSHFSDLRPWCEWRPITPIATQIGITV